MVDKDTQERILAEYDANAHTYAILAPKLEQLLREILPGRGIQVHSITSRPKSRKSLAGKLAKNDATYEQIADLTDLVGLRVTTYFAEDVDRVAAAIAQEFDIDPNNSIDKRRSLAADRFGYLSLHHVLSLKESRCELTEYKAFKGLKIELQTRSILQHAWAEIEHDLGYKSEIEVPQHIRRRFALVAGLLELADREFDGIKAELETYREKLSAAMRANAEEIALDLDSISALLEESTLVKRVDDEIIQVVGASFLEEEYLESSSVLEDFQQLDFTTIGQIATALQDNASLVVAFARNWIGYGEYESLSKGISLFYLWYVLISNKTEDEIIKHVALGGYHPPQHTTTRLIAAMVKARQEILPS